jgi:hypothetical protein
MRRCGMSHKLSIADKTGYKPNVHSLKAIHKVSGNVIEGIYHGLSTSGKTLKIGETYVDPAKYDISVTENQ